MILLDTTILVYAVGAEHPLRQPCRAVVRAIGAGQLAATTTLEAIQEFAHVRARRRGRADAVHLARAYADLLSPLETAHRDDLDSGLRLFQQYDMLGAFDAVLAAIALHRPQVSGLASADQGFQHLPGLVLHDPAHPRFLDALGL
jgi:predicted nucleic acid-binding protein